MKTIAFYLPQFHEIEENNMWWGKGFTEWTNMKKAAQLYEEHYQPRIPLKENYYDLTDINVMRWQTEIAKANGVHGFCFYHYWFDGKLLLERPVEQFLKEEEIDFPYCICWANEDWTNSWNNRSNTILIKQTYGDEEMWKKHYEYLKPFFKDERYIKKDGKPFFIIYRPEIIPNVTEMLNLWNELAVEDGLGGITYAYQHVNYLLSNMVDDECFKYHIEYQPMYARTMNVSKIYNMLRSIKKIIYKLLKRETSDIRGTFATKVKILDYDSVWEYILNQKPTGQGSIPCAFVDWDNTPRKGDAGVVIHGASPEKFKGYFSRLINKCKNEYNQDMIFVFAWNEWAEGGYLEPDERYGFGYLNAVKEALLENGEYPYEVEECGEYNEG